LREGTVLVDVLSGREITVQQGRLDLPLEPLTPMILKVKS
jgi:hypothetical protein